MDLVEAFAFAQKHHALEKRKGTDVPFIQHPMAVAALVIRHGGNEAQARAALLHDTISDDSVTEAMLAERFGAEAARLAHAFADPTTVPGDGAMSWSDLKKAYLAKLRSLDETALLVVACEELHECTELLQDLRHQGASVWKRYPVHAMEVFWYFRELLSIFVAKLRQPSHDALVSEFGSAVKSLKGVVLEGQRS